MLALLSAASLTFTAPPSTVPARGATRMASVRMLALDDLPGASVEVPFNGGKPWDPWGLSKLSTLPESELLPSIMPSLAWLREAEAKHCRLAMLGFLGIAAQQFGHIPGGPAFESMDWYGAMGDFAAKNPAGAAQIFLFIALVEGTSYPDEMWSGDATREPGNLGFDPLGLGKGPKAEKYATAELKNGRAAMIFMTAAVANHFIPGSAPGAPA